MYDYDGIALTEDERSAGIGYLISNNSSEYHSKKEELRKEHNKNKILLSNKSNKEIKDSLINQIIYENILDAIEIYSNLENLPKEFVSLAKEKNCLMILLKGFFYKECNIYITEELVSEIEELIKNVYSNHNLDIVYFRVKKIQKFIHSKVKENKGKKAHKKLNVDLMRNILSTARLHLNIYDIENKSIDSLSDIINKTLYNVEEEFEIKTVKNYWRATKMKSIFSFTFFSNSRKIHKLIDLETSLPKNEFVKNAQRIVLS